MLSDKALVDFKNGDLSGNGTLNEIKHTELQALLKELGPVGMIKFLQQFETGMGDYSEKRHR